MHMGVSKNHGTPKSSILIGFSIINHPFWGTPIFGSTPICAYCVMCVALFVYLRLWEPWDGREVEVEPPAHTRQRGGWKMWFRWQSQCGDHWTSNQLWWRDPHNRQQQLRLGLTHWSLDAHDFSSAFNTWFTEDGSTCTLHYVWHLAVHEPFGEKTRDAVVHLCWKTVARSGTKGTKSTYGCFQK